MWTFRSTPQSSRPFQFLIRRDRRIRGILALLFLSVLLAGRVSAQEGPTGQFTVIPVACFVDGIQTSDIPARLSADGKLIAVDARTLTRVLGDNVRPTVVAALTKNATDRGMVDIAAIVREGLSIAFDPQSLSIRLKIPMKLQKVRLLDLNSEKVPDAAVQVAPATFSAQLSVHSRVDVINNSVSSAGGSVTQVPVAVTLDPAVNYRTWVLESELSVDTSESQPFSLVDLRAVKDLPGPDLRLMAGDLSYPTAAFMSAVPMVGIGVTRNFHLTPSRLYRPLGQMEFYLNNPSQVRVLVNGSIVRYLELQPGAYNLSDFPLTPGMNDVVLEIHDYQGRVDRINGSFAFAPDLLIPGESSFTWNIGLPGRQIGPPVLSGFQRIGLLPNATMGAYIQADTANQITGLEGMFATSAGTFHLGVAGSHVLDHGFDMGAFASYSFFNMNRRFLPSGAVAAQYRGQYFLGPENTLTQAPYRWIVSASLSQALPKNLALNLSAGYRLSWSDASSYNGNLILTVPLSAGTSLAASVGANVVPGSAPTWLGSVTLISTSGGSTTAMSMNQNLVGPNTQMGVSYRPTELPGLNVSGELIGPPGVSNQSTGASATVSYSGNRFDSAIGHSIFSNGQLNPTTVTNHSFARFSTAFVYADGAAGIARPVNDDFAIFLRNRQITDTFVGVNPLGTSYQSESDFLGNAVLSDISSYTNRLANVAVPQAPIGYDLGQTLFLLRLPYRSGAVIRVGKDATVYVDGTLVDGKGKPIPLVAGTLASADPSEAEEQFFTDDTGHFQAYGLKPGRYYLSLASGNWTPTSITIPKDASGLFEIGAVKVTR